MTRYGRIDPGYLIHRVQNRDMVATAACRPRLGLRVISEQEAKQSPALACRALECFPGGFEHAS